jgi:transposase
MTYSPHFKSKVISLFFYYYHKGMIKKEARAMVCRIKKVSAHTVKTWLSEIKPAGNARR